MAYINFKNSFFQRKNISNLPPLLFTTAKQIHNISPSASLLLKQSVAREITQSHVAGNGPLAKIFTE